jgi:hypothetical protein
MSGGVGRWLEGLGTPAGHRGQAERRRAPWVRDAGAAPAGLPPPNNALEPTAPKGSLCPCVRRCLGAAAHRERSASIGSGNRWKKVIG